MKPAWMCLPPAVLAAFVGVIAAPAGAHAQSITSAYGWDDCITLRLHDGRVLGGRWRGTFGSLEHPADYDCRYEKWRGPWGSYTGPALGESLLVSRSEDQPVSGAFRGFCGRSLLIGTADSCAHLVVTLNQVTDVRRSSDPATEPEWTAARERWTTAPSLDAIVIQSGPATLAVPAAMVASDAPKPSNGASPGGGTAALVVLGVVAVSIIAYYSAAYAVGSIFSGIMGALAGAHR